MQRVTMTVLIFFASAGAMLPVLTGCGAPDADNGRPIIFVSIPPQAYFADKLAGDRAAVHVLLPPGVDSHSYEPRPSQLQALANASLYVRTGADFENASWDRIRGANRGMTVVDGREGVALRHMTSEEAAGHSHGHDHGHAHDHGAGDPDPHIWLDPRNMQRQVRQMSEALQEIDPDNAEIYAEREAEIAAELEALDEELRAILRPVEGKTFWVYHPAWGYFADAYGLRQAAIQQEGKDPGVQSMERLVRRAQAEGVSVIFGERQFDTRRAKVVADEIGAEVAELDPLAENYPENLRAVATAIRDAVS